jgi:hypothetical protein
MIILVDQGGVVADLERGFLETWTEKFGSPAPLVGRQWRRSPGLAGAVTGCKRAILRSRCEWPRIGG